MRLGFWCILLMGLMAIPIYAEDASVNAQIESLKKQLQLQSDQLAQLQVQSTLQTRKASSSSQTTFGGYGETNLNMYSNDSSRNKADLRRFVLTMGHQFNDRMSFNGEIEWEHAIVSADDEGEVEIEQANITYQITPTLSVKAGLFLMPFGLLNESHESPTYYGVERNEVETRIIPSTWREGGIGLKGITDSGFTWDVGITTGFNLAKFEKPEKPLAGSHQELQLAKAKDLAYYGALNYRNLGFLMGGAIFTGDAFHSNADYKADNDRPDFAGIRGNITLWDIHTRWQVNKWDLQAVYASGAVGDAGVINNRLQAYNLANSSNLPYVPNQFCGWLVQSAYTLWQDGDMSLSPFVRYEKYNTQSSMPSGFDADTNNADQVLTVGASFKPHPEVAFKVDYKKFMDHSDNNRLGMGMGYMF